MVSSISLPMTRPRASSDRSLCPPLAIFVIGCRGSRHTAQTVRARRKRKGSALVTRCRPRHKTQLGWEQLKPRQAPAIDEIAGGVGQDLGRAAADRAAWVLKRYFL